MNILLAATHITRANGGVSTHIIDLCVGLQKLGHTVYVTSAGGEYVKNLSELGIEHIEIPFMNIQKHPMKMIKVLRDLKRLCKNKSVDIIHAHGQSVILFAQFLKIFMRIPFVWTNHIDAVPQPKLFQVLYNIKKFPIISVSQDLKKYLLTNFKIYSSDITVINNGIYTDKYVCITDEDKDDYRKSIGINKDNYVITLPGRLTYGKGHIYLIKAIEQLNKLYPTYKFTMLIAGNVSGDSEKTYLSQMLSQAKMRNVRVNYVGFQDMNKLMSVSNIMCLPSLYEGFGIVCAEAFLMKVPVVRSDTPGSTDMYDICKVFPKGNIDELVKCISDIIDNIESTDKMKMRAYKMAISVFSVQTMTEKTVNLYKKICEKE